ncbi:hypothetical protein ElyMa_001049700 [Elysia marginata]|uniref:Uncharacterized protein n=1 Tax=Elysia marginata TaxID=1093978 RepID=A0AAV4HN60_9GAST|nr:hypothetical protein ElyMa_001049700 [Elysia marginata]
MVKTTMIEKAVYLCAITIFIKSKASHPLVVCGLANTRRLQAPFQLTTHPQEAEVGDIIPVMSLGRSVIRLSLVLGVQGHARQYPRPGSAP